MKQLDFSEGFSLDFQPLARKSYPLYDLALSCGEAGGVLPTALNAASEVAVNAFLKGNLRFTDIYTVADKVVQATKISRVESYPQLEEADARAREGALKIIEEV